MRLLALVFAFLPALSACGTVYTCKDMGRPVLKRLADGTVKLTAPCDGDPEAVVMKWKKFDTLKTEGLICSPKDSE